MIFHFYQDQLSDFLLASQYLTQSTGICQLSGILISRYIMITTVWNSFCMFLLWNKSHGAFIFWYVSQYSYFRLSPFYKFLYKTYKSWCPCARYIKFWLRNGWMNKKSTFLSYFLKSLQTHWAKSWHRSLEWTLMYTLYKHNLFWTKVAMWLISLDQVTFKDIYLVSRPSIHGLFPCDLFPCAAVTRSDLTTTLQSCDSCR